MPLSLGLYTTVAMVLISSPFCTMCNAAVAGGVKRQRPQHQHLRAFYGGAFLSSGTRTFAGATPTPPLRRQQQQLQQGDFLHRDCCDFTTSSLKSWKNTATRLRATGATPMQLTTRRSAQLRPQARGFMTHQNPFSSGSLSSAPRPPPSPKATTTAPPRNVAVLARGDSGDDLERCRRLAQKLGVELVVPRREGTAEPGKGQGQKQGKGRAGAVGGAAEEGNPDSKFTMLFDERGRLALDQPGSGFNPLVVDFSGGKTGYRSKHQQGKTEQVVKAAALPKRRAAASTSAAAAATDEHHESFPSSQSLPASPPPTSMYDSDENDEVTSLPLLWDLTAGLGTDSFLLAQAGWRVEMFERSPVVAALVQDGLDRALAGDDETARTAASRMSLSVAESTDFLATFGSSLPATQAVAEAGEKEGANGNVSAARPDVVYLDPMFPQPRGSKRKSALVKKGMQMLQALLEEVEAEEGRKGGQERFDDVLHGDVGDPREAGEGEGVEEVGGEERRLFDVAMSLAARKVVVKRPVHGEAIVQHVKPSHAVVSKNGRFDVYVVPP